MLCAPRRIVNPNSGIKDRLAPPCRSGPEENSVRQPNDLVTVDNPSPYNRHDHARIFDFRGRDAEEVIGENHNVP